MIKINNTVFYDMPESCGSCSFFCNGRTNLDNGSERGHCRLFDEMHHRWIKTPRKCLKFFKRAFGYSEGIELVIVKN